MNPRFELIANPVDDQRTFHLWATALEGGERYDYGATLHEFAHWARAEPGIYPQAPGYPFLIAAIHRVFPGCDITHPVGRSLSA